MSKNLVVLGFALLFLISSCSKDFPVQPRVNQPPKTLLWLFPDSTIAPGVSRQRIHWWGEDPDGFVVGYLFAFAKLPLPIPTNSDTLRKILDTLSWSWTRRNDTLMAFPLLTVRDTFTVFIRAVDNSIAMIPDDQSTIRLSPQSYWDKNNNHIFDGSDAAIPSLTGAMDPKAANQWMPLRNQPPSVKFSKDPNNPTADFQQPETTYTAATFSWSGTDPDGNQTISSFRIALNDTSVPSRWVNIPRNDTIITLFAPRSRSDGTTGEVAADIYGGNFLGRRLIGTVQGLKLDSLNVFYVQAKDVAGEFSPRIRMPDVGKKWFVKKPRGRLLLISDYVNSDSSAVLRTYDSALVNIPGGAFINYSVMNIGRGLLVTDKIVFRPGALVPPFLDPAFIHTLRLFDYVLWYTDQWPSLAVAQSSLFYYTNFLNGRVIFSTSFLNSSDPRGALVDFAPIDSVSSVDLNSQLLPRLGDTRIPGGYRLLPDSSNMSNLYPIVAFDSTVAFHSSGIFFRPIYRRADARYIYRLQEYTGTNPVRYTYLATTQELRSVWMNTDGTATTVGGGGSIFYSPDGGLSWTRQTSGVDKTLRSVHFPSSSRGWTVGDGGSILMNSGGSTWTNQSVVTTQDLLAVRFFNETNGLAVGTKGIMIKTTNGGNTWAGLTPGTLKNLRSVFYLDQNTIVVAGDSNFIIKTTNAGTSWTVKSSGTINNTYRTLNAIRFLSASNGYAVGSSGTILRSTDAGESWALQSASAIGGTELRSLNFADPSKGWISGVSGSIFLTQDGGTTWTRQLGSPAVNKTTQNLNSVLFLSSGLGVAVGTSGVILRSPDGGVNWDFQPKGALNVGVVDGARRFVFLGVPLHLLKSQAGVGGFLQYVLLTEFGP